VNAEGVQDTVVPVL